MLQTALTELALQAVCHVREQDLLQAMKLTACMAACVSAFSAWSLDITPLVPRLSTCQLTSSQAAQRAANSLLTLNLSARLKSAGFNFIQLPFRYICTSSTSLLVK